MGGDGLRAKGSLCLHYSKKRQYLTPIQAVPNSTFYGLAVLFMVCVCGILLNPPAVPLESSGKVMEMGEHPPSQWGSAAPPTACCERPLSHPGYGRCMGSMGMDVCASKEWARVKSVEVPWLSKLTGNSVLWPAKPSSRCHLSQNISLQSPEVYGFGCLWVVYGCVFLNVPRSVAGQSEVFGGSMTEHIP